MRKQAFDENGELTEECRRSILESREELEALAESDTPGAPIAQALLRKI